MQSYALMSVVRIQDLFNIFPVISFNGTNLRLFPENNVF